MLTKLQVKNFRSIRDATVDFGPITIFFGPTASGKSSLLYALLVLRNFINDPTKLVDGLFNLGFQNLGGFEPCIFNHLESQSVVINALVAKQVSPEARLEGSYELTLRKTDADIATAIHALDGIRMAATVSIPYGLNQSWPKDFSFKGEEFTFNWNGFASTVAPKTPTAETQITAAALAENVNFPVEGLRHVDICPHRRGFFKPFYTSVPVTPIPTTEDEVASLIITDANSAPRISIDTVEIFDRDFRTHTPPGTNTTFFLTAEQTGARVPGYLVNDGFGVNQVVYMLAKIHRPEINTILIEEPEVHLHPTVIRKFARVVARLAIEDQKQLIFTTHSEQFLLSMLACVAEQLLPPEQLACYRVTRDKKATIFDRESVSSEGQISGGLASFMEAELKDIKTFLGVTE